METASRRPRRPGAGQVFRRRQGSPARRPRTGSARRARPLDGRPSGGRRCPAPRGRRVRRHGGGGLGPAARRPGRVGAGSGPERRRRGRSRPPDRGRRRPGHRGPRRSSPRRQPGHGRAGPWHHARARPVRQRDQRDRPAHRRGLPVLLRARLLRPPPGRSRAHRHRRARPRSARPRLGRGRARRRGPGGPRAPSPGERRQMASHESQDCRSATCR